MEEGGVLDVFVKTDKEKSVGGRVRQSDCFQADRA